MHNQYLKLIATIWVILIKLCCIISAEEPVNNSLEDDLEIDPFDVREDGCPIVAERHKLNLTKLNGNWSMPFASLNWLADIGMALYNRSVKMSQITTICPRIILIQQPQSPTSNVTWSLQWKCPKLHGEFELRCWRQSNVSMSKFTCWNDKEDRDIYIFVGGTDHSSWIVLTRCSPGEPGKPSEGMSWAILSKTPSMDPDTTDVLFGLLEGYGFDVDEFKTPLYYNNCTTT